MNFVYKDGTTEVYIPVHPTERQIKNSNRKEKSEFKGDTTRGKIIFKARICLEMFALAS